MEALTIAEQSCHSNCPKRNERKDENDGKAVKDNDRESFSKISP